MFEDNDFECTVAYNSLLFGKNGKAEMYCGSKGILEVEAASLIVKTISPERWISTSIFDTSERQSVGSELGRDKIDQPISVGTTLLGVMCDHNWNRSRVTRGIVHGVQGSSYQVIYWDHEGDQLVDGFTMNAVFALYYDTMSKLIEMKLRNVGK